MATPKPAEPTEQPVAKPAPAELLEVHQSFTIEVGGVATAYSLGELVDPHDPVVRSHRALLRPFAFPHPVR